MHDSWGAAAHARFTPLGLAAVALHYRGSQPVRLLVFSPSSTQLGFLIFLPASSCSLPLLLGTGTDVDSQAAGVSVS